MVVLSTLNTFSKHLYYELGSFLKILSLVIEKYLPPPEASLPGKKWRFHVFKDSEQKRNKNPRAYPGSENKKHPPPPTFYLEMVAHVFFL